MRLTRVFIDAPLRAGELIALNPGAHHHLAHVLRLKAGGRVIVFNGLGNDYAATLHRVTRGDSSAFIDAPIVVDRESALEIELWQGISRGARMDYVLQKAVELGVARVRPVVTRYTSPSRGGWIAKLAHWRAVIVSACEQSGRTRVPELYAPQALIECTAPTDAEVKLALDPDARDGFRAIAPTPRRAMLLIGPEGGLADDELEFAQRLGFVRVRMGPRTLRTETAGVAALAAAQVLWGDLG
ncbi:MAG: 16S rRNA (uracil(1498)-N(3))-methyltransferase [Gammaproteobacteria bacterium]|nr:16S rRNA (uracil(1498)-N(3))-methyltransferase [Gammaproteobacteria bacterium]